MFYIAQGGAVFPNTARRYSKCPYIQFQKSSHTHTVLMLMQKSQESLHYYVRICRTYRQSLYRQKAMETHGIGTLLAQYVHLMFFSLIPSMVWSCVLASGLDQNFVTFFHTQTMRYCVSQLIFSIEAQSYEARLGKLIEVYQYSTVQYTRVSIFHMRLLLLLRLCLSLSLGGKMEKMKRTFILSLLCSVGDRLFVSKREGT